VLSSTRRSKIVKMAPGVAFMGGKLNLKGDKKKKHKKKSKKSKHSKKVDPESSTIKSNKDTKEPQEQVDDELTDAERKSLRFKNDNEQREFEKNAGKSHRERIEEFNTHLGSLTELNDIPRVSAAGNG